MLTPRCIDIPSECLLLSQKALGTHIHMSFVSHTAENVIMVSIHSWQLQTQSEQVRVNLYTGMLASYSSRGTVIGGNELVYQKSGFSPKGESGKAKRCAPASVLVQ